MCPISNNTRSNSGGEESSDFGDFTAPAKGKQFYQDLVRKANTVPLVRVFKYYGLNISDTNHTIICPFKSHQGGRERSGSFKYYSETNSFFCYGCKVGGQNAHSCEFMAAMDETNSAKAAFKILKLFSGDVSEDGEAFIEEESFSERLEIIMEFSNFVRDFIQANLDDPAAISWIEKVTLTFDQMNERHTRKNGSSRMDNNSIKILVSKLKVQAARYNPCQQL